MIITPLFVIFLVFIFTLVWFFVNTIDNRKWLTFLVSVGVTPLVYFFIFYPFLNIFSSYHHEKYFDTEAWVDKPDLRYEMINQIQNDSLLLYKSKKEVEILLGKSEWDGWSDNLKTNSENIWNYNLGFKPGAFNKMQECLQIIFLNNKVVSITPYKLEKTFE